MSEFNLKKDFERMIAQEKLDRKDELAWYSTVAEQLQTIAEELIKIKHPKRKNRPPFRAKVTFNGECPTLQVSVVDGLGSSFFGVSASKDRGFYILFTSHGGVTETTNKVYRMREFVLEQFFNLYT